MFNFVTVCKLTNYLSSGGSWVIGKDFRKGAYIASWPQKIQRFQTPKPKVFSFFPKVPQFMSDVTPDKRKRRQRKHFRESLCPLETRYFDGKFPEPFKVWNGYQMVPDASMNIECAVERVDSMFDG